MACELSFPGEALVVAGIIGHTASHSAAVATSTDRTWAGVAAR